MIAGLSIRQNVKTEIKSYGDDVTDFYGKEIPKIGSNYTSLAVISLNSALNKDGSYYPHIILKECKYIKKRLLDIILMT